MASPMPRKIREAWGRVHERENQTNSAVQKGFFSRRNGSTSAGLF